MELVRKQIAILIVIIITIIMISGMLWLFYNMEVDAKNDNYCYTREYYQRHVYEKYGCKPIPDDYYNDYKK